MFNRGNLILVVFLALAGNVKPAFAQRPALEVQVLDYADLDPKVLNELISRTQQILDKTGVLAEVRACDAGAVSSCGSQTGTRRLVVRIVKGEAKRMKNVRRPPLGQSFADQDGGIYASVFLARVQDAAEDAGVPWTIVLSYAAAHEIGHLLLGSGAHTPRGVMKANWDLRDFQEMDQNHFGFSDEQTRELATRYGGVLQPATRADAARAVGH